MPAYPALDTYENSYSIRIERVAVMIVTTCVIPILVLMAFTGVLKFVTGLNLPTPTVQSIPGAWELINKRKKKDIKMMEE